MELPPRMAALVAVLALAGCWRSGEAATRAPVPPAPPISAPAQPSPSPSLDRIAQAKQDALQAYLAMYDDVVAAGEDWNSPRLPQHATGQALALWRTIAYRNTQNGLAGRGQPEISGARIASAMPEAAPTTASVTACVDGRNWPLYVVATGRPVNDLPGDRRLDEATIDRQPSGEWMVQKLIMRNPGSC
jgi:hypothetical protein